MKDCIDHGQKGNAKGYGYTRRGKGKVYKTYGLHRLAYAEAHDIDVETLRGKVVMHSCDNPRCINPEHLSVGTHLDNMADMMAKGRQWNADKCPRGIKCK